jgi:hypothetical protein
MILRILILLFCPVSILMMRLLKIPFILIFGYKEWKDDIDILREFLKQDKS